NNAADRRFMDKIFNWIAIILNWIAKHNHAWHNGEKSGGINVGTPSLSHLMKKNQDRDQMMAVIATNIALLTKKLTEFEVKKVHAIEEALNNF
ncbi:hypothetical protein HAX54_003787, partial [Datura stramonium]|nr:hypothetical protein [Datura stramonium]